MSTCGINLWRHCQLVQRNFSSNHLPKKLHRPQNKKRQKMKQTMLPLFFLQKRVAKVLNGAIAQFFCSGHLSTTTLILRLNWQFQTWTLYSSILYQASFFDHYSFSQLLRYFLFRILYSYFVFCTWKSWLLGPLPIELVKCSPKAERKLWQCPLFNERSKSVNQLHYIKYLFSYYICF